MVVAALGFTNPVQAANAGDLDASVDSDGRVVFDVFGGVDESAEGVAIQRDGKIVLAGRWCWFAANCNTGAFALAGFNPFGSLDTAFGSNGRTLIAFPNGWAEASAVAIQTDGKIVAVGMRNDNDGVGDADFALARYDADGDLDASFSGDGKQTPGFGDDDYAHGVVIQADGTIVAAGYTTAGDGIIGINLARYNANGSLRLRRRRQGDHELGRQGHRPGGHDPVQRSSPWYLSSWLSCPIGSTT